MTDRGLEIQSVLGSLNALWSAYPQLRLGQVLFLAATPDSDQFYTTDAEWIALFKKIRTEVKQ